MRKALTRARLRGDIAPRLTRTLPRHADRLFISELCLPCPHDRQMAKHIVQYALRALAAKTECGLPLCRGVELSQAQPLS